MTEAAIAGTSAGVRSDFERDGFALLPGLLSAAECEVARAAVDAALAAPSGMACERPHNTLVPLRWDDQLVELLGRQHERIARAVGARDLRWTSGYLSIKDPHSPPLWWHQDWWAWDHPVSFRREAPQVAVLCYLSDTSVDTGALRVIPGSHASSTQLHAQLPEAHSDDSSALSLDHAAMADHEDQVTLALRAGDAVVSDYRLLHGTHANNQPRRRACVISNFAPSWRELPEEIRAHLVSHPSLLGSEESPGGHPVAHLLPEFTGERRDLALNRNAPARFTISG